MTEPHVRRNRPALTAAGAWAMALAAVARAEAMGVPECIAVVDGGGALLAFTRMDGARAGSIPIAQTKAISAATRLRATADEAGGDILGGVRLALAGERLTNIGGGLPIVVDGETIGAIGVSSGTVDEDVQVATAGLAALQP